METITPAAVSDEQLAMLSPQPDVPAPEAPVFSQEISQEQPTAIPEKFRGKGINEVVESYQNLESEYGKTKQELQSAKQRAEEADQLLRKTLWDTQSKPQYQQNQPSQEELEDAEFMKLWERDPAAATRARAALAERRMANMIQDMETRNYYQAAQQHLPGFKELEPRMRELLAENAHLIRGDRIMSPQVVNILYNIARAETIDARMNDAKRQGLQEAQRVQQEKASAFAEGSSTSGPAPQDFAKMSIQDMQKTLGYVVQD